MRKIILLFIEKTNKSIRLFSLSLVLRRGKEEIERKNSLISSSSNNSLSLESSSPSLHRRLAQTDSDTELGLNSISECELDQAILETQLSAQELQQKAKVFLYF